MSKAQPGEPLRIAARDWNTLVDVAEVARTQGVQHTLPGSFKASSTGVIVPCRNNTGASVPRFHAVGLGAPLFTYADNAQTFLNQLGFIGEDLGSSYLGRWAVVQETLPDGKIGSAMLSGITAAQITVAHADHPRVDIDTAGTPGTQLVSSFYGAGEILYKESGTGSKWAVIRIGSFVTSELLATADEDIAVGDAGDVVVKWASADSETVQATLDWMAGTQAVSEGDELLIRFMADTLKYQIIGAGC